MTKHQFKILSIDGGGIRGIIPAAILQYIESKLDNGDHLSDYFDLFAGTSTGGIISLGLITKKPNELKPYSATEMLGFYIDEGNKIFQERMGSTWINPEGLGNKPYSAENLEKLLFEKFYDSKLSDVVKDIIISSYDIEEAKPFYFKSRLAKFEREKNKFPTEDDKLIKEIARSTSAAPTFFNPSEVDINGKKTALVDGGVFANNPAILAYAEAKEIWRLKSKENKGYDDTPSAYDDDLPFFMLSIGTGKTRKSISLNDVKDERTFTWLKFMSNILMDGVAESTDYSMKYVLPTYEDKTPRYVRLDIDLPKELSEMDNASVENINALLVVASDYIFQNEEKLSLIADIIAGRASSEKWELLT